MKLSTKGRYAMVALADLALVVVALEDGEAYPLPTGPP